MTLSQEAQDALNGADCVKNVVMFPHRLEKEIFEEIEAAMKAEGGTYTRSLNAFVFDTKDPKAVVEGMLG